MAAAAFHDMASGTAPTTPTSPQVRPYFDSNKRLASIDDTPTTRVFVDRDSVETLTNKTLTSPTINAYTITGTGTIANGCTITTPAIAGATITGTVTIANGCTITTPALTNPTMGATSITVPSFTTTTGGTLMTTPTAGVWEADSAAFYNTMDTTNGRRYNDGWNYFRLTGSGSGITTIADFFGANDGIPLVANGVYEIEWVCYFSQATAGIATWTVVTATTALANITGEYLGSNIAGIGAVGAPQMAGINATTSSSTAFPVSGTEATGATHCFRIRVLVTAGNGSSNTRLRLAMSAGTATPLINSYFRVRRLPGANAGTFVA